VNWISKTEGKADCSLGFSVQSHLLLDLTSVHAVQSRSSAAGEAGSWAGEQNSML